MIVYYNKLENQLKDKSIQKHVVSSQDNFLENNQMPEEYKDKTSNIL